MSDNIHIPLQRLPHKTRQEILQLSGGREINQTGPSSYRYPQTTSIPALDHANPPFLPREHELHPQGDMQWKNKWEAFVYLMGLRSFGPHSQNGLNIPMRRHLSEFHVQLMGLGAAIGTGFLIGSGQALRVAGPVSALLAFAYVGLTAYLSIYALGELSTAMPVKGAFIVFSGRFLDQAWGAAIGWNYGLQWLFVFPLELIAASITLQYWTGSDQAPASVYILGFLAFIVFIHLFGIRGFGNFEAGLSVIKIVAIVGFLIFGICRDIGLGFPQYGPIGAENWYNPGFFHNGWKGFFSVMIIAAFAHSGVEITGLSAASMQNPQKDLPKAVRNVFWRIVIFYMGGMLIVGLLVKYTDRDLLGASKTSSLAPTTASPFIIAIKQAKVRVLPTAFNVVVLVAVLSVANSSVFGATQALISMAENGTAPKWLSWYDRRYRPLAANGVVLTFGFLAFFAQASFKVEVFDWFLAISGLSVIMTWSSICAAHIAFRRAYKAQALQDQYPLPFFSPYGTIGSYIGLCMNLFIILMQVVIAIWPVDYGSMSNAKRANNFFQTFTAFLAVIVIFLLFKFKFGKGWKLEYRTTRKNPSLTSHDPNTCVNCSSGLPINNPAEPDSAKTLNDPMSLASSAVTQNCDFINLKEMFRQPATYAQTSPGATEDLSQTEIEGTFGSSWSRRSMQGEEESFVSGESGDRIERLQSMEEGGRNERDQRTSHGEQGQIEQGSLVAVQGDPDAYRMNLSEKWIAWGYHRTREALAFPWP